MRYRRRVGLKEKKDQLWPDVHSRFTYALTSRSTMGIRDLANCFLAYRPAVWAECKRCAGLAAYREELTSVDGVGDIDVVGQRDVLDLNAGLLALFFDINSLGSPSALFPASRHWQSHVTCPRFGFHCPSFHSSPFPDASHHSLPRLPAHVPS
jgi:hypothetical protein